MLPFLAGRDRPQGHPLLSELLGQTIVHTLVAARGLTEALLSMWKAEPARVLGQDTLQRCHRVLGPDHPITLYLTRAGSGHLG